jgi:hypothetical protein
MRGVLVALDPAGGALEFACERFRPGGDQERHRLPDAVAPDRQPLPVAGPSDEELVAHGVAAGARRAAVLAVVHDLAGEEPVGRVGRHRQANAFGGGGQLRLHTAAVQSDRSRRHFHVLPGKNDTRQSGPEA